VYWTYNTIGPPCFLHVFEKARNEDWQQEGHHIEKYLLTLLTRKAVMQSLDIIDSSTEPHLWQKNAQAR